MTSSKKILLEMSGGLDSSSAAILLQQQGYEVVGAMMHLHEGSAFDEDVKIAESVAKKLGIKFEIVDFRKEFNDEVVGYFVETYKNAKTPNPCIICNQKFKFGRVFELAKKLNCEKIATGHYARIEQNGSKYELLKAKDLNKDQSYVLHFLDQEKLAKTVFPLGDYSKDEIRALARSANLPCIDKDESMDICFVEDKAYPEFILKNSDYIPEPGNVVDIEGNILGQHEGLINYTIGQRKGLGLAFSEPMYVLALDKTKNEVVLGTKEETFTDHVLVNMFNWIGDYTPTDSFSCQAKLRYRQSPRDCVAHVDGDSVRLEYPDGIDSVTPGQFAVLYDGDKVLGGGTII